MYSRKLLRALFGIRLRIDNKSATLDFRGTVFFKGEAGCVKINSRLFGLMRNTITIYNICIFIHNDNISQTRWKCLT